MHILFENIYAFKFSQPTIKISQPIINMEINNQYNLLIRETFSYDIGS